MLSASALRRLRALELTPFSHRIRNQQLAGGTLDDPAAIVSWLGAVQSQDYTGAKWGVAQRGRAITEGAIDEAYDVGRILRTHVMRPTWHFVARDDIRWMQSLTAPRVHVVNGSMYRKLGLDAKTLVASRRALERALTASEALTRPELQNALRRARIVCDGHRLAYIVMHAELEQVICSGPRRGKQFTYSLLDRRAPRARRLDKSEALLELTRRYFSSHGPATDRDFSWWSGLTMKEARAGIEAARSLLTAESVLDRTYWFAPAASGQTTRPRAAYLLSNYDECLIAYRDRGSVVEKRERQASSFVPSFFAHHVLAGDRVIGGWRRGGTATAPRIEVRVRRRLTGTESRSLAAAVREYERFAGRPVTMTVTVSDV